MSTEPRIDTNTRVTDKTIAESVVRRPALGKTLGRRTGLWPGHAAHELGTHVRQREKGSLVVSTDSVRKTETDEQTREDVEKDTLFMKGYTVFNVEQIDDLPIHDYAKPERPTVHAEARNEGLKRFVWNTGALLRRGGERLLFGQLGSCADAVLPRPSAIRKATMQPRP